MNYSLSRLSNIPWRALPAWLIGDRLRILMYHSIADDPMDSHAISLAEFERQMLSLQAKNVVSLAKGLELLNEGCSLKNTWVITFDDALLDFYTSAFPVIRKFNHPVTMFVPTGMVGGKASWDSFDKSKSLMSWEQLEECQQWNVSFGSHTVHHAALTECADETLRDELTVSLQMLRARLTNILPALAYPGGFQDLRVRLAAQKAGYACAVGVSSRWGNGAESDLMQLRRERFRQ